MPLGLLCSMALVSWQASVEGVEEGASGMTASFSATWVGGGNVYFSFGSQVLHVSISTSSWKWGPVAMTNVVRHLYSVDDAR